MPKNVNVSIPWATLIKRRTNRQSGVSTGSCCAWLPVDTPECQQEAVVGDFLLTLRSVNRKRLCVTSCGVPAWWRGSAGSPRPCGSRWPGWPRRCSRCTPCTGTSRTAASGTFRRSRRSSRAARSSGTRTTTWSKQQQNERLVPFTCAI